MSLANSLSQAGKMNELAGDALCGETTGGRVEVQYGLLSQVFVYM